jgi:hypothetical protein
MGRPPKQKQVKEYLVNPKTRFLFSDAAEFRDVFPKGEDHIYLTKAEGGKRLGKGTFRIIGHLPQKHNQKRDEYEQEKSGGGLSRFMRGGPLEASRMRYDAGSYPGFHLIVHTQEGKRQEFYLTSESRYAKGSLVYGTVTIPSKKNRQLVVCPVRLGHFGVSKSKPGQYKLSLQKPKAMCGVTFIKGGHVGEEHGKKWDEKSQTVKAAESGDIYISEAESSYFYAAQGIDLLSVQDVEVSESESQARAWSNPSDAMTGNETLEGYEPIDSVNVDLSSNQPTANYGAEEHGECFSCGERAVSEALGRCLDCGQQYNAESDSATYSPSEDPDMVSSSSFDDPTNAHFSAEAIPVAEGTSLTGYEPVDSVLEEAPIGHGVTQNFGGEGLEEFDPIASVVVEPPLGHGVAQWYAEGEECEHCHGEGMIRYGPKDDNIEPCAACNPHHAEGDEPEPVFDDGITGQDGPETDPTNSNFTAQGYNDREDESIGRRHRGRHSQSRKDRRDEAAGMERHGGRRKYSNVGTMDLSAETLSRGSKSSFVRGKGGHLYAFDRKGKIITHNAESAFDKLEGTIEDEYLEKGYSPEKAKKIAGGAAYKAGVRSHGGGKKGKAWMRRAAKRGMKAEAGYIGDMTLEGYQPIDSIEVDRSSYQPTQDYGAEAGYIGDMTLEGYQPMDSIEVDRSSYQPTQDYGADFKLEKPVTTGFLVSLGAFCFAGAATLGTVLLASLLMKDE